jgi:hypothetical protein
MPEIVNLTCKNIESIVFVASLALIKQLKTQKFKAQVQDHRSGSVAGTHLSSAGVRLTVCEGHDPGNTQYKI